MRTARVTASCTGRGSALPLDRFLPGSQALANPVLTSWTRTYALRM